ncbi:telomerase protein component 1-like [Mya arenaria]|uniref:telomerase protein component 1-like n=1 Tax=Mya arenaria TaxID=6604 RepID=UPI0022E4BBD7|nr:telomerase protein component 1-like [Mya arenaria]XP_052807900.1 telomerase protein component 1-like [Mya arenaria]
MYKQYRSSQQSVDQLLEKSFSNLSVTDLKSQDVLGDVTESSDTVRLVSELSDHIHVESALAEEIQKCWDTVDSQCSKYNGTQARSREPDDGDWKTIRVFVSSTFTDFFCEREVLVKKVFPELREWLQTRKLYLVDCDLRWGVPHDATTAETIAICLDELDRCMEGTGGEPFFLNLLGEKYGWCPADDDLSDEVRSRFDWVPETSITFMEILHGAIRMQNNNAQFAVRTDSIIKDVPGHLLSRYKSSEPRDIEHLKELKHQLQERFSAQIFDYQCKVDGVVTKFGKEIVNVVELEEFAERVLTFFKTAVTRMFPNRSEAMPVNFSTILTEDANQRRFVSEISNNLIGRKSDAEKILAYVNGEISNLEKGKLGTGDPVSRKPELWGDLGCHGNELLCVQGKAGHGKTTLMAWVTQHLIKAGCRVFYHFCGCSGSASVLSVLLQRLLAFLTQDYTKEFLDSLYDSDNSILLEKIKQCLVTMATNEDRREKLVFVFDGLDQLTDANSMFHLSWLPPHLPGNVRCIVSTSTHPPTLNRIQEHAHLFLQINNLQRDDAQTIVETFLGKFNKRLDPKQLQLILDSKCSESPFWLYLICEELRIYGDFRTLTHRVQAITTSMAAALQAILTRLVDEDDTGAMKTTLCLIACSDDVITCLDLQRMLGDISAREALPPMTWSRVRRHLKAYLRILDGSDTISFVHADIKRVIQECFVKNRDDISRYHTKLCDYIEHWCENTLLRRDFLAFHMVKANLHKRLLNFLRNDLDSSKIPSFRRSSFINDMRCRHLADPVIKGVHPAQICRFCRHGKAVFHPSRMHLNERMCVVCGGFTMPIPGRNVDAHLCNFHGVHIRPESPKCFLCGKIQGKEFMSPAVLCMHCQFHNNGKRCCVVEVK